MSVGRTIANGVERPRDVLVWLRWVVANLAGEAVGFVLGMILGFVFSLPFGEPEGVLKVIAFAVEIVVMGGVLGTGIGIAQHLAIGRFLPGLSRREWVAATIPGAIIAFGATMAILNWAGDSFVTALGGSWPIGGLAMGLLAGAILSVFQWISLRRVARRASIWVPAHAGAWAVAMLLGFAAVGGGSSDASGLALAGTSTAAVLGVGLGVPALTGLAVLWVLRGEA